MRKQGGNDHGSLYAMKVLKKASIVQKKKTAEHTMTERQVLEAVRQSPFLVTLYYAFQTDAKLHLILGWYISLAIIPYPLFISHYIEHFGNLSGVVSRWAGLGRAGQGKARQVTYGFIRSKLILVSMAMKLK